MRDLLAALPSGLIVVLLLFIGLWLLMAILVAWDVSRQQLPGPQRWQWILLSFLPLAGPFIYLVNRPSLSNQSAAGRRFTALKPPDIGQDRRPPTILAADLLRQENAQAAAQIHGQNTYRLVANEGPYRGKSFSLASLPARIGRDLDCAVRLDDDHGVSRHHAELYQQDGRLRVKDLNSTHGTFVNGRQIQDATLTPGDKLLLGHSLLLLEPQ